MNRKQIRRDYRNVEYVDDKGKVRTKVEYRGATYAPSEPKRFGAFRIGFAVLTAIGAGAWVAPLCFNSQIMRTIYFTLPYVLQVFALLVMVLGAYNAIAKPLPYREETHVAVVNRTKVGSIAGAALALAAEISFTVYASVEGADGIDFVAMGCAAVLLVAFGATFALVHGVKFDRTEPAKDEDQAETEKSAAEHNDEETTDI